MRTNQRRIFDAGARRTLIQHRHLSRNVSTPLPHPPRTPKEDAVGGGRPTQPHSNSPAQTLTRVDSPVSSREGPPHCLPHKAHPSQHVAPAALGDPGPLRRAQRIRPEVQQGVRPVSHLKNEVHSRSAVAHQRVQAVQQEWQLVRLLAHWAEAAARPLQERPDRRAGAPRQGHAAQAREAGREAGREARRQCCRQRRGPRKRSRGRILRRGFRVPPPQQARAALFLRARPRVGAETRTQPGGAGIWDPRGCW